MAQKWNLQDIVPPEKRRATAPRTPSKPQPRGMRGEMQPVATAPAQRPPVAQTPTLEEPANYQDRFDNVDAVVERLEIADGRLSRMRRYIVGGVLLAIVLFVGFATTILLSGAEVTIKPKVFDTTVQATFTAKIKPGAGELGYELLTLEEVGEKTVAATGQEEIKAQATGKITVYNAFSSTPQRLIKNTRFESPNGLIYRITDSIVIPGYKKDASGETIPGSVTAEVFADSTGEAYNLANARFSVPGLKGSEQFDKIYAETVEGGIQGGFEGVKFIIDETELATTKQKLDTELRDKLLSRIASEQPNDYIAFDPSVTFVYESLPASEGSGKTAVIKERVRLLVPLFRKSDLASFLAQNTSSSYDKAPVRLDDPKKLTFSYDPPLTEDITTKESLTFKLSGPIKIIWQVDQEKLKKELIGVSKSDVPLLFSKYSSIENAETVVRPIWKTSFPEDTAKITIIESIPGQ
jgi:hypothetical protein